ncbi:DUF2510 domain-containing protein [Micromonospora sp. NPDC047740]|uniref:DUF2510 domain-containing protein n=1 Tax=Micromonospora sp. NPDC047740 TaxID=3364254 RepID=UPI0037149C98
MQGGGDGATVGPRPGWYPDPSGRQPVRWFDGDQWTAHVIDGRQQPQLDPLPDGAAPPPVPPGPPPVVSGAPAPAPGQPSAKLPVGSLVVRCLILGIVAVLLVLGFLALPYAGVDSPPRDFSYAPVRYLELGAWLNAYDTKMSTWGRAYSHGLGPLIALVVWAAVAGTVLLVALVPRYRTREPWWTVLVFVLAVAAVFGAMVASPSNDTILLRSAAGYLTVLAAHALLVFTCPLKNRRRRPR